MTKSSKATARDVEIGRELAQLRQAANITQGELGAAVGISGQQVSKYERGESQITVVLLEEMQAAIKRLSFAAQGLSEEAAPYEAPPPPREVWRQALGIVTNIRTQAMEAEALLRKLEPRS